MFESQSDALAFRNDLVQLLDRSDTDGWQVSPTLEGATLHLNANAAAVRGQLDGAGYRVRDETTDDVEADGWASKLAVRR